MNVSKMLSIPYELEKAIALIKLGRTRKIDLGVVTRLEGEKLTNPYYFLESAGVGLEAELFEHFVALERGSLIAIPRMLKAIKNYYLYSATVILDNKKQIKTKASLITVSNGPYTGAAFLLAPKAKLNDHRLTISIFKTSKLELFQYAFRLKHIRKARAKDVKIYRAKEIKIITHGKRLVHADARLFGETPVEFSILPNALNVVTGFPKEGESYLVKKTYLDA